MKELQFARIFGAFFLIAAMYSMTAIMISADALAQSTVDVRPAVTSLLEWVAMALTTALTVLVGFGVRFVTGKIGLQNSELEASLVTRLDDIIHKGIDYAYTTAVNEVNKPGSGLAEVKIDNWFMALALSYVNDSAPGIIAKFGLTPQRIEDMIKARLPAYMANIPVAGGLPTPPNVPASGAVGVNS